MRSHGLADGPQFSRTSRGGVSTGVSLRKSRRAAVGQGVDPGRECGVGFTAREAFLRVVSGHNPFASHFIQGVLAHLRGGVGRVFGGADSQAELGVRHVVHPFLVVYVGARDVGGHISADGVSVSGRAMGVKFATCKRKKHGQIGTGTNQA